MLAIADSLDAMMSKRPHRAPLSSLAVNEITEEAGGQFDPAIVEVIARAGETVTCQPRAVARR